LCKEVSPGPPSRNSTFLGHPEFLLGKSGCPRPIEIFGKGLDEEPTSKEVLPELLA
jgi:hypothetical protein